MSTPYEEDSIITAAAEAAGFEVIRQRPITISDKQALKQNGLMRETPDYPRIRALLNSGAAVCGASLGPVEYVIRRPGVRDFGLPSE